MNKIIKILLYIVGCVVLSPVAVIVIGLVILTIPILICVEGVELVLGSISSPKQTNKKEIDFENIEFEK